MTTAQLSQTLTQLSDSLKVTNTLVTRLATLTFQPGAEPLEGDGGVRTELAQDIRDSLRQLEEELEVVKHDVEDLHPGHSPTSSKRTNSDSERERARLDAHVARLTEDLQQSRSTFRRAQLHAKRASDEAKQKERELVYAALRQPPPSADESVAGNGNSASPNDLFAGRRLLAQKSKVTKEELEVDASSNVTAALRRTHDLLSTELSRSRFAQETFDQSTAALAELGEHYSNLDTILTNSRNLLGTLLRSQKSDTWYLETAFYILLATLCWLVFRRLLIGPFVRLPLFFWNIFAFLLKWILWKPLYFFLTLTGVVTTDVATTTKSRKPLIVQPSASGGVYRMADGQAPPRANVPAGAGGANAKVGLVGQKSEEIARQAEESARAAQEGTEQVVRGDGTVLKPRDPTEEPRNPLKKAFEADVEDAKLEEQQQQQRKKRDEL